jgi:alpha-amylase
MANIALYLQLHQPRRIRPYHFFELGQKHDYFNDALNLEILEKVSVNSYRPAASFFESLIQRFPNDFGLSLSASGILLEQLQQHQTPCLEDLQRLTATAKVEWLGETYFHSLCSLYDPAGFIQSIRKHSRLIRHLFQLEPRVFRNTELIAHPEMLEVLKAEGYQALLTEGLFPNEHQTNTLPNGLQVLYRHYPLSDAWAFEFHHQDDVTGLVERTLEVLKKQNTLVIGLDYETFGEHYAASSGILPAFGDWVEMLIQAGHQFVPLSSLVLVDKNKKEHIDTVSTRSWADREKDLSAWLGNSMQQESMRRLYELKSDIERLKNPELMSDWQYLTTSDHFYYMSTKSGPDAQVHRYFSSLGNPHEAFISYMNILSDLELRVRALKIWK